MPIAAVAKIADAVVMPRTNSSRYCTTTPAPMKPMPVMTPASACGDERATVAVTAADAPPTSANVRSPAGERRSSRSKPITKARANPTMTRASRAISVGTAGSLRVGADLGHGSALDLRALEVGERADAEAPVALGGVAHALAAPVVVVRAVVTLARGRVAGDEHPAGGVGAVGFAVVRRHPVDQHRVAGRELGGEPLERRRHFRAHDAAVVDRQHLVDAAREPETARLEMTVVDRDEDGCDA